MSKRARQVQARSLLLSYVVNVDKNSPFFYFVYDKRSKFWMCYDSNDGNLILLQNCDHIRPVLIA